MVKQAEKIAGCWRVYVTRTGEISACKITQCSCAHRESDLKTTCKKLPNIVNIGSVCRGWPNKIQDITNAECRKCDVDAPSTSQQYLALNELIDPRDVYMCRSKPNLGTILSDFIVDLPKQIWDGVNTAIDFIFHIIIFIGIFLFGGTIVAILFKFDRWYRNSTNKENTNYIERFTEKNNIQLNGIQK